MERSFAAFCNVSICILANFLQWTIPYPLPGKWFDEDGKDMGEEELRRISYMSFFVYLTAQVLILDAIYYMFSFYAEGRPGLLNAVSQTSYKLAVWINGLSIVTGLLFYFFFTIMVFFKPRWREQWNYYDSLGYAFETRMHTMHLPLLLCPIIDFVFVKRRYLLRMLTPSKLELLFYSVAYVIFYAAVSTLNYSQTSEWVYVWMYDFTTPLHHILYHCLCSLVVCGVILVVRWCVVDRENLKAE